jgi:hypothetical protein
MTAGSSFSGCDREKVVNRPEPSDVLAELAAELHAEAEVDPTPDPRVVDLVGDLPE